MGLPAWRRFFKYVASFAVIMLQMIFISAIVAGLYVGYFVVQSTDMDYIYQVVVTLGPAWRF